MYGLYSGATEANPLTQSAQSYGEALETLTAERAKSVPGAVSNIQGNPNTGFFRFERQGVNINDLAKAGAIQERVYLNVKADKAPEVMRFVVNEIVDKAADFPGVFMSKLAGPGAVSGRAESIVIYMQDQAAAEKVLARIQSYQTQNPAQFMGSSPRMTEPVAPGVSVGSEPLGSRGAVSFGQVRSDAILEALDQSMDLRETREQFQNRVLEALRRRGVDPDAPHLNLPKGKP